MVFKRCHTFALLVFVGVILAGIFAGGIAGAEPQPGDVINGTNVKQYMDYFPAFMERFFTDGWNVCDPITVHVAEKTENLPCPSFLAETEKNAGKTTLNADGSLSGYTTGTPFLDPKEPDMALKLAWNCYYRWRGDDFCYPNGFWSNTKRKGGRISNSRTKIDYIYFTHRTVLDPKPNLENPKDLHFAMLYESTTPQGRGMVNVTWRYEDSLKNDDMWVYIPTMRRTMRLVSSERGNPVRGSPFTWDDFYGFDGKILMFDYEMAGEQSVLGLYNLKSIAEGKYKGGIKHPVIAGPDDPYELRDVYIISAKSKDPRYPESKKDLYLPKDHFYPIYTICYDKQGRLWKGLNNGFIRLKTLQGEYGCILGQSAMTDFKTEYWTQNHLDVLYVNVGINQAFFMPSMLHEDIMSEVVNNLDL
ncbi:MAG: DUF1329 domain-containing protein [Desulfobacterales bacterium]